MPEKLPRKPKLPKHFSRHSQPRYPIEPEPTIKDRTVVHSVEVYDYSDEINDTLAALLEQYPLEEYSYVLDISGYHDYHDSIGINASFQIYNKGEIPNPRYEELKAKYDQDRANVREARKEWKKNLAILKAWEEECQEIRERNQYEKLRKKFQS